MPDPNDKNIRDNELVKQTQTELHIKNKSLLLKETNDQQRRDADLKEYKTAKAIKFEKRQEKAEEAWRSYVEILGSAGHKQYSRMQMGYEDAMYELSLIAIAFGKALAYEQFTVRTFVPKRLEPVYDTVSEGVTKLKARLPWNRNEANIPKIEFKFEIQANGEAQRSILRNGAPMDEKGQAYFDGAMITWLEGYDYHFNPTVKNFVHSGTGQALTNEKFAEFNNMPGGTLQDFFKSKMKVEIVETVEPEPTPQPRL